MDFDAGEVPSKTTLPWMLAVPNVPPPAASLGAADSPAGFAVEAAPCWPSPPPPPPQPEVTREVRALETAMVMRFGIGFLLRRRGSRNRAQDPPKPLAVQGKLDPRGPSAGVRRR